MQDVMGEWRMRLEKLNLFLKPDCSMLRCSFPRAATVDLIAQNGFDFRLSQVAAYGNGLYFAGGWPGAVKCTEILYLQAAAL
jgi:hypothetical protein